MPRFARRLPNRIVGASGALWGPRGEDHLYIGPADGTACPARAPGDQPEIQAFWTELCDERVSFGQWTKRSPVSELGTRTVVQDLKLHRVEVMFVEGHIADELQTVEMETKEAVRLVAKHHDYLRRVEALNRTGADDAPEAEG